jgi:hypothetical protein
VTNRTCDYGQCFGGVAEVCVAGRWQLPKLVNCPN